MIGTIGCSPGLMREAGLRRWPAEPRGVGFQLSRSAVLPSSRSSTAIEAPTIAGASVLENR
jgi:hypothetical protein